MASFTFRGHHYREPHAVLTEGGGEFYELPSGRRVDPVAWLHESYDGYLAGFLSYEFG